MTSASELFYTRRSRFGRTSPDLGIDSLPPPDRSFHQSANHNRRHHHNHHHHHFSTTSGSNHRHDIDGCDPLRRYPHSRHISHRVSNQDRSAFHLEESAGQSVSSNRIDTENFISSSRPSVTANERLPGAVLLARARLRERLRGVTQSGSRSFDVSTGFLPILFRPRGRSTFNIDGVHIRPGDDTRPFDARDWDAENSTRLSIDRSLSADLSSQTVRLQILREQNEKPPGLTQEALSCLQLELFSGKETDAEAAVVSSAPQDCSICLESFIQGDRLICLPCDHRFHAVCLDPWVRISGDCPYCRSAILVKKRTIKSL
ncbi:probable E3 ubiquitin-protein ligase RHY1A isoform X2 [Humulus lupulus]|uniref:probable E3 ubiquitin-protein ligase RHY1A isoform X2 n=1 Tax=Humulus lupulus TaxID=3486 RepID=UPI002B411896|nr:probable E3 ubiquitin-protein ligase RHY1A isoform X2 [Humulus lupulus]